MKKIIILLIIALQLKAGIKWGKYGLSASNSGLKNSKAIEKAIKDESAGGSCVIDLPKGVIKIARPIKVTGGMIFKGHGASFNKAGTVLFMTRPVSAFIATGNSDKWRIKDLLISYPSEYNSDTGSIGIKLLYGKNDGFPSEFIIENVEIHKPYIGFYDNSAAWGYILRRVKVQQYAKAGFMKDEGGTTITMEHCVGLSGYNGSTGISMFGVTSLSLYNCAVDASDAVLDLRMVDKFIINGLQCEINKPTGTMATFNTSNGSIKGFKILNTDYRHSGSMLYFLGQCMIEMKLSSFGGKVKDTSNCYTVNSNLTEGSIIKTDMMSFESMVNDGYGEVSTYKTHNNFRAYHVVDIPDSVLQSQNDSLKFELEQLKKELDHINIKDSVVDKQLNTIEPQYKILSDNKIWLKYDTKITVYNMSGQQIAEIETIKGDYSFNLSSGLYVINLLTTHKNECFQIVIKE